MMDLVTYRHHFGGFIEVVDARKVVQLLLGCDLSIVRSLWMGGELLLWKS